MPTTDYPADGPTTPTARNVLDHWEDEGGPDPEMVAALVQIEKEARSLGARTDEAAIAATLDMDFSVLAMTDQPLLPVEDDGYHEHTGVPCRTCVAMGLPTSIPAEATVVRIHHGDPDSHARSFNQGWGEALRDAIADIPEGANDGWSRYDTDDTHTLSVYANGETWDVIAPKSGQARSTPVEALDVDTVADAFRKMAKVGPGFDARIDSGDIGSTPLIRPSDLAAEFVEALSPHNREAEDTIAGLRGRGFGVVASPSAIEDSDDTPVRKAISE